MIKKKINYVVPKNTCQNCDLYSSQKPPKLFGVIASVKSKGWYLEVSQNSL